MKGIKNFGCIVMISLATWFTGIYDISVTGIDGGTVSLSAYQGKKILVITLPVVQNNANDSLLRSIDSLAGAYTGTLAVIAVPSYEDGFSALNKNDLKQWYRSFLRESVWITDGMYTRKTSGSQQHALFRWLTDKDQNGKMNIDVEGPGHKYFIRANGSLQSVFNYKLKLKSRYVTETMQSE